MKTRSIILVLVLGTVGCQAQRVTVTEPARGQRAETTQEPQKRPGKVFTESELIAMGFKKTDLRPHYLSPVFVKRGVSLGNLARELRFAINSVQATMQASGPDDAYHVLIPTGICYIGFVPDPDGRYEVRRPKALVNATVLQVPLQPYPQEGAPTRPLHTDRESFGYGWIWGRTQASSLLSVIYVKKIMLKRL